ncbi:MAG: hypothetical protein E7501_07770 [Ruminococcus sp.]|nr:hypothetical protein [Ruminococcus sp.]
MTASRYDVAAFVWPSYTGDELRSRIFWPEGIGEWQTVARANAKFDGHSWPRKPLWGYVNEADPAVMEMQIEQAVRHGVNVFIYDWYWYDGRPFLENCLNDGFLKAQNRDKMKFYIMWANHDANHLWSKTLSSSKAGNTVIWEGAVSFPRFQEAARRLIGQYFHQPNYYTINGAPVLMIYDIQNLLNGLGGVERTREALDWFREEVRMEGFPDLHLQFTSWGEKATFNASGIDTAQRYDRRAIVRELGFDSLTNYQFVHMTNMNRRYAEAFADIRRQWAAFEHDFDVPYFPHVSIGWDNNPRFDKFLPNICQENTPEEFEKALRAAKEYVDTHNLPVPLITVNSWNEWTETSYLEPDDLYGYGYLEAVRRVFGA